MNFSRYCRFVILSLSIIIRFGTIEAQRISPTPISVIIPSPAPQATGVVIFTPTPTLTPTERGGVMLVVRTGVESANVRALPDLDAERIGSISPGETYAVIGRYFRWINFQYDERRTGWVYDELIEFIGDTNEIIDVDPYSQPTPVGLEITETFEAFVQTPGGEQTATASARVLVAPTQVANNSIDNSSSNNAIERLPTFTPPPNVPSFDELTIQPNSGPTGTPRSVANADTFVEFVEGGIPPILPIIAFGGLGLLGLLVAIIRR